MITTQQNPFKRQSIFQCLFKTFLCYSILFIILGIAYPYAVTYTSLSLFKDKASGSLIKYEDRIIGSKLIGQDFSFDRTLFQSRPSVSNYDSLASGGSNYSIANQKQLSAINKRKDNLLYLNNFEEIPSEMLTASASGLDPHISKKNAYYQATFIAKARKINLANLHALIDKHSIKHMLSNDYYVNVLELNLDLQKLTKE